MDDVIAEDASVVLKGHLSQILVLLSFPLRIGTQFNDLSRMVTVYIRVAQQVMPDADTIIALYAVLGRPPYSTVRSLLYRVDTQAMHTVALVQMRESKVASLLRPCHKGCQRQHEQ